MKKRALNTPILPSKNKKAKTKAYLPYMQTLGFKKQGPTDAVLRLDDGTELPCHTALLTMYSGVLRELINCTAAGSVKGSSSLDQCCEACAVPVKGDTESNWTLVLHQLYLIIHGEQKINWAAASACIQAANKYDMPSLAKITLNYVSSKFAAGAKKPHFYLDVSDTDDESDTDSESDKGSDSDDSELAAVWAGKRQMSLWAWAKEAERWDHAAMISSLVEAVADGRKKGFAGQALVEEMRGNASVGQFVPELIKRLLKR